MQQGERYHRLPEVRTEGDMVRVIDNFIYMWLVDVGPIMHVQQPPFNPYKLQVTYSSGEFEVN